VVGDIDQLKFHKCTKEQKKPCEREKKK